MMDVGRNFSLMVQKVQTRGEVQNDSCVTALEQETSIRTHVKLNKDTEECIQIYFNVCLHTWAGKENIQDKPRAYYSDRNINTKKKS